MKKRLLSIIVCLILVLPYLFSYTALAMEEPKESGEESPLGENENPSGGETTPGENENPSGGETTPGGNENPSGGETTPGGNENPSGGETTPGGNEDPSGGETTPGGNENPSGGETTPGGNEDPSGGGTTPGGNENSTVIDKVEFTGISEPSIYRGSLPVMDYIDAESVGVAADSRLDQDSLYAAVVKEETWTETLTGEDDQEYTEERTEFKETSDAYFAKDGVYGLYAAVKSAAGNVFADDVEIDLGENGPEITSQWLSADKTILYMLISFGSCGTDITPITRIDLMNVTDPSAGMIPTVPAEETDASGRYIVKYDAAWNGSFAEDGACIANQNYSIGISIETLPDASGAQNYMLTANTEVYVNGVWAPFVLSSDSVFAGTAVYTKWLDISPSYLSMGPSSMTLTYGDVINADASAWIHLQDGAGESSFSNAKTIHFLFDGQEFGTVDLVPGQGGGCSIPQFTASGSLFVPGEHILKACFLGDAEMDYSEAQMTVTVNMKQLTPPTGIGYTVTGEDSLLLYNVTNSMAWKWDTVSSFSRIAPDENGYYAPTRVPQEASYLQVMLMGDGVYTSNSEASSVAIARNQAPALSAANAADCTNLTDTDGAITGVDGTMEYMPEGGEGWTDCAAFGGTISGLAAGNYLFRTKYTAEALPSLPVTLTVNPHQKPAAPATVFTPNGDDSGILTGVTAATLYSFDGENYTAVTEADLNGLVLENLENIDVIYVKTAAEEGVREESDVQTVILMRNAAPEGVEAQACVVSFDNDGKLLNMQDYYEYRLAGEASYTLCAGTEVTGLVPGDYEVRTMWNGEAGVLASKPVTVTVKEHAKPEAPEAMFTATGADMGVLTGVDETMEWSTDGAVYEKITGTEAVVDIPENADKIYVKIFEDAEAGREESKAQAIELPRGETPLSFNIVRCSGEDVADGEIDGIDDTMEYKAEDSEDWLGCIGLSGKITDLTAGIYYIRRGFTPAVEGVSGALLASKAVTIEIEFDKVEKPEAPDTTFTASGANTGVLTNLKENLVYSLDGVNFEEIDEEPFEVEVDETAEYLYVKIKADPAAGIEESEVQEILLPREDAPKDLIINDCKSEENNDGSIAGLSDAMEYHKEDEEWQDCPNGRLEGLTDGIYYVRRKYIKENQKLASAAVEYEIRKFIRCDTPTAEFKANGSDTGILTGVTDSMAWSEDQKTYYDITGDEFEITVSENIAAIYVKERGDGKNTGDSDAQIITLPREDAPAGLTYTNCINDEANGTILNVNSLMEYRKESDTEWKDCTGEKVEGLTEGKYLIRTKSTEGKLASRPVQADIKKSYRYEPSTEPTTESTAPTQPTQPTAPPVIQPTVPPTQPTVPQVSVTETQPTVSVSEEPTQPEATEKEEESISMEELTKPESSPEESTEESTSDVNQTRSNNTLKLILGIAIVFVLIAIGVAVVFYVKERNQTFE